MSLLSNLKADVAVEESTDVVASGGPLASGIYTCTVNMAYLGESDGGAASLTLHLQPDGGREFRHTLWLTSGRAKGQKPYYETRDGKKRFLPGFEAAQHLSLLTAGIEPENWTAEEKVVNLWNSEAKKEVPTKVQVVTDLMGKRVIAGVLQVIEDKNVKDASGNYVPSGETRTLNEVDKFFREKDRMTVVEIKAQTLTEGEFINAWTEKWDGEVRDKSTKDAGAGSNVATGNFGQAAPAAAASAAKPQTSLFS